MPPRLAFKAREFSGGLGDLGTFLPLSLGVSIACGMDFGLIVLFAGVMNIATGLLFGQPIPVQPMKAIAAIAIAGGMTQAEVRWAGVWMGAMLLAIAMLPRFDAMVGRVPRAWIGALQAGIGLKLAWLGVEMIAALPVGGADGAIVSGGLLIVLLLMASRAAWLLPLVVGLGALQAWWMASATTSAELLAPTATIEPIVPTSATMDTESSVRAAWSGLYALALPQLPLTLLNSVVAVCALSAAYYPGRGVPPKRMTTSVAVMNVVACPLGGMPMCHGAGGLAAQHHFGARTGGSVVMLGVLKASLAIAAWPWLAELIAAYPAAMLAPLLIIAGGRLAWAARPAWQGLDRWTVGLGAGAIFFGGTLIGVAVTVALGATIGRLKNTHEPTRTTPEEGDR
ncbi:MAG: putative sulfate/molybdate transporter [Planctomycetota bacterium]